MRTSANAMRGKRHSLDARAAMSAAKSKQYREGRVMRSSIRVSAAEREIYRNLAQMGLDVRAQYHIPGASFFYDFFLPAHGLIIEYQGDYWHANPVKYKPGTRLSIQNVGVVAVEDIWKRDKRKRECAEYYGFRVQYVWESDYKLRGMEAVICLLS